MQAIVAMGDNTAILSMVPRAEEERLELEGMKTKRDALQVRLEAIEEKLRWESYRARQFQFLIRRTTEDTEISKCRSEDASDEYEFLRTTRMAQCFQQLQKNKELCDKAKFKTAEMRRKVEEVEAKNEKRLAHRRWVRDEVRSVKELYEEQTGKVLTVDLKGTGGEGRGGSKGANGGATAKRALSSLHSPVLNSGRSSMGGGDRGDMRMGKPNLRDNDLGIRVGDFGRDGLVGGSSGNGFRGGAFIHSLHLPGGGSGRRGGGDGGEDADVSLGADGGDVASLTPEEGVERVLGMIRAKTGCMTVEELGRKVEKQKERRDFLSNQLVHMQGRREALDSLRAERGVEVQSLREHGFHERRHDPNTSLLEEQMVMSARELHKHGDKWKVQRQVIQCSEIFTLRNENLHTEA